MHITLHSYKSNSFIHMTQSNEGSIFHYNPTTKGQYLIVTRCSKLLPSYSGLDQASAGDHRR